MKFVPKDLGEAAEASSGGGQKGVLKEVLILAACFIGFLALLHYGLLIFAEIAVERVSMEDEMAWFGSFDQMGGWEPGEKFEEKTKMVEVAFAKLMASPLAPKVDLRLGYMEEKDINAFAVPGGQILLTKGLLESFEAEAEVAFILAHEIGHFQGRHHLKRMSRTIGSGLALTILFQGVEASRFVGMSEQMLQLAYSREQEQEADDFALQLATEVYGESPAFAQIMEKLFEGETLPEWAYMFMTHPNSEERLGKLSANPSTTTWSPSPMLRTGEDVEE
ncbi:MAG: M48 family metallopeptidase [Verrucomicrobiota bacterium]